MTVDVDDVSVWRLMGINGAAFGHEVSACVAYTYVPPLLLKAGFSETAMTVTMGIAPFLALFTIPVMGRWSDAFESPLGRRRPFILAISALLIAALLVIPYADAVCVGFGIRTDGFVHSVLLAGGVVVVDYASLVVFNPCEALLLDLLEEANANVRPKHLAELKSARRFAVYSAAISAGSCLGYLITAVHWQNLGVHIGRNQEQTAFLMVILFLILGVTSTMWLANEVPSIRPRSTWAIATAMTLTTSSGSISVKRALQSFTSVLKLPWRMVRRLGHLPTHLYSEWRRVPPPLRRLFVSTLVSWLAINCQGLFFTDYVGQAVYEGRPDAAVGSPSAQRYDAGVRRGCLGLFLHGVLSCVYSVLVQDRLTERLGLRGTYVAGMAVYGVSMAAIVLSQRRADLVTAWALVSGTGFAVVTTAPPCLVALYGSRTAETANGEGARGFGGDIAILDCAFCLSRILLGSLMGATVDWTGLVDCYIVAAGLLALLACLLAARLDYDPPAPTPLGSLCCEKSFRDNFKVSQESLTSLESLQSEESMDSLVPSENSTGSLESIGSES